MNQLGFRGQLFAISLALVALMAAISGVVLETSLRAWFDERQREELISLVKAARALTEWQLEDGDAEGLHRHIRDLGGELGARITVIASDGLVIADSALAEQRMLRMDDHSSRPEIQQAQKEGLGVSLRYSDTVGLDMLYVAIPFEEGSYVGTVRVAKDHQEAEATINKLRALIIFGVAFGIVVAAMMGAYASRFAARSIEELVVKARAAAAGHGGRRIEVRSSDELARLAGSFNMLAADLETAVAELAAERDRVESILRGLADGVLALDAQMNITAANPAAVKLLKLPGDVKGRPLLEAVRLPVLRELAAQALRGAETRGEARIEGRPPRILEVTATPHGAQGHCVLLLRDVTELRRLEAVRRDFVANVSHELRTPISTLSINAETLLGGALDDPQQARSFIEGMHRNAVRLARVVNDLLDLSRIEAGRYKLDLSAIEAARPVGAVLDACDGRARRAQLDFDVDLDDDLRVVADAKAIEHVLVNLVDNAIKYTPPTGKRIGLRARRTGDRVRFEVWDTGPGIAEQHRARLFERFYRVDAGRSREQGGTGLGLSIVRHLVEAMGGSVGMQPNEAEGGSIFWVELPSA